MKGFAERYGRPFFLKIVGALHAVRCQSVETRLYENACWPRDVLYTRCDSTFRVRYPQARSMPRYVRDRVRRRYEDACQRPNVDLRCSGERTDTTLTYRKDSASCGNSLH